MKSLEEIRIAVDGIATRGRGRRFPPELKASIIVYVRDARRRGVPTAQLESNLNISWRA
jgi:hypothetical protein